jgi:outer membrane protein assembly factor BamE (lipoprotein component of BamABCDE complex)
MSTRRSFTWALLGGLFSLQGCLVSTSSQQERSGNYVAETTFDQIEPGKTTDKWIIATIGQPDTKSDIGNGGELWKWSYTEVKKNDGAVFLIFAGSDKKETTRYAFVELKDGVVTKKWRG